MNYTSQPYVKIREKLLAGELSVSSIVTGHLDQIQAHNKALNAFLEVYEEEAILKAVHDVCRVTHDDQALCFGLGDWSIGLQCFECCRKFHALVGRLGLTARTGAFARWRQRPRPSPRTRVTAARPIGIHN